MLIINAKTAATALKLNSSGLTPVFKCVSKFTSHSKRYTAKKYGNEWRNMIYMSRKKRAFITAV